MKLWIDNTGLQSGGLCLEGRARPTHDYDVRGLLQLATLVIYGNKVSLNGFEDDIVAERTHVIVERLRSIGINEDILSISPVSQIEYALACRTAADSVAQDLGGDFGLDDSRVIGAEPPDLPRGMEERQVKYVSLANEQEGSSKLEELEESALRDKAIGAVEYMMACSPALREGVARILARNPNFDDRQSYDLNILLRYHLNDALAGQSFSRYAPAIGRAERVSRRSQYLLEALGAMVDRTVNDLRAKLRAEPLGVPSILAALLQRSKGEPQAVLTEAMKFREYSKALRDALEHLAAEYTEDIPESRFEIQKQVAEFGEQLRRDVGLNEAASLRDAVEIQFVFGVPVPSVSGKKLIKWVQELRQRKRVAVLTELVKASAYSDPSAHLYKKLRTLSTRAAS